MFSVGQAITARLERQIKKCSAALSKLLLSYNSQSREQLDLLEVSAPEADVYRQLSYQEEENVASNIKNELMSLYKRQKQGEEEKKNTLAEMEQYCESCDEHIGQLKRRAAAESGGRRALLMQEAEFATEELATFLASTQHYGVQLQSLHTNPDGDRLEMIDELMEMVTEDEDYQLASIDDEDDDSDEKNMTE